MHCKMVETYVAESRTQVPSQSGGIQMIELKARHIVDVYDSYYAENPFGERSQVYLKSEADKVIANRDCKIKKLHDSLDTLLKAKTEQIIHEVIQKTLIYGEGFIRVEDAMKLIAELRHQKFKRCLAMARWCRKNDEFMQLESNRLGLPQRTLFLEYRRKAIWWNKWYKRWLELADKFKEAK